jgi:RNA polymerase sigma-70 factor (ECF subfamily)
LAFAHLAPHARIELVDGAPALLVTRRGRLVTALQLTIVHDKITLIDIVSDPERLSRLR